MAFALTKVVAYGVEAEEAVNKRYRQVLVLSFTCANSDVSLDIGDTGGTFWGAVDGSEPGDTALKAIKAIQKKALTYLRAGSTALGGKAQVVTASAAGNYAVAMDATNTHLPSFTFHTASAPTSQDLVLEWLLKDGENPIEVVETA